MEPLSEIELDALREAGAALESSGAWDEVKKELERRKQGVIQAALLGKLDTYEDYLEKRADFIALHMMITLPSSMKSMGAN